MAGFDIKFDRPEVWAKAKEILGEAADFDNVFHRAALQELQFIRRKLVEGFQAEAPGGQPWKPLSPLTLAVRKFKGFSGTKILQVTRDLLGSITVVPLPDQLGGFVGVARRVARKDGMDPLNLAEIHEGGKTFARTMTAKQRRFLFAAMRAAGIEPQSQGFKGPVVGTAVVVRIPPRPFLAPVFDRYAKPADVERRMLRRVAKLLGGRLGTAEGGSGSE